MIESEELKKSSLKQLLKELSEARVELFKIEFEARTGQEKATHKIKNLKKYIAQILTILNSTDTSKDTDTSTDKEKAQAKKINQKN